MPLEAHCLEQDKVASRYQNDPFVWSETASISRADNETSISGDADAAQGPHPAYDPGQSHISASGQPSPRPLKGLNLGDLGNDAETNTALSSLFRAFSQKTIRKPGFMKSLEELKEVASHHQAQHEASHVDYFGGLFARLLLVFSDKKLETAFVRRYSRVSTPMIMPLFWANLWSLLLGIFHRWETEMSTEEMAVPILISLPGFLTVVLCICSKKSRSFIAVHYSLIWSLNVLVVAVGYPVIGLVDELRMEVEQRCPAMPTACPHHASDQISMGHSVFMVFMVNLVFRIKFQYLFPLNFIVYAANAVAMGVFADTSEIIAYLVVLACVHASTLFVARQNEVRLRLMLGQDIQRAEHEFRIASILSTVLPPRLVIEPFEIPLIESFECVPVLFCSFDKDAVMRFVGAKDFFDTLERIYLLFDEVVASSGLWKVEHVGEDYVVSSHAVATNAPEDDTPEMRQKYAAKIALLALSLVQEGNSFAMDTLRGGSLSQRECVAWGGGEIDFKFKAGIHCGPIIAGVAGRTRRFYRFFGDTVVTAARMCHHCATGRVQVSAEFHEVMGPLSKPLRERARRICVKGKQNVLVVHYLDGSESPMPFPKKQSMSNNSLDSKSSRSDRILEHAERSGLARKWKKSGNPGQLMGKSGKVAPSSNASLLGMNAMPMNNAAAADPLINKMFRGGDDSLVEDGDLHSLSLGTLPHIGDVKKLEEQNMQSRKVSMAAQRRMSRWKGDFVDPEHEGFFSSHQTPERARVSATQIQLSCFLMVVCIVSSLGFGRLEGWSLPVSLEHSDRVMTLNIWFMVLGALLVVASSASAIFVRRVTTKFGWSSMIFVPLFSWLVLVIALKLACNSEATTGMLGVFISIVALLAPSPLTGLLLSAGSSVAIQILISVLRLHASHVGLFHIFVIFWNYHSAAMVVYSVSLRKAISERRVWLTYIDMASERLRMQAVLVDLLPAFYAYKLVDPITSSYGNIDSSSMSQEQMACVLFSDLSGFTRLTEMLGAAAIMDVMHNLWSCFDSLVQKYGMYKMDTVGDAYVVIALCESVEGLRESCEEMVQLAKEMVVTLSDFSGLLGQEKLQIRIGIDCGDVIAGVMGKMQPRFHAHGAVMSNAQRLEGQCIKDSVLVSPFVASQLKKGTIFEEHGSVLPSHFSFFSRQETLLSKDRLAVVAESGGSACEEPLLSPLLKLAMPQIRNSYRSPEASDKNLETNWQRSCEPSGEISLSPAPTSSSRSLTLRQSLLNSLSSEMASQWHQNDRDGGRILRSKTFDSSNDENERRQRSFWLSRGSPSQVESPSSQTMWGLMWGGSSPRRSGGLNGQNGLSMDSLECSSPVYYDQGFMKKRTDSIRIGLTESARNILDNVKISRQNGTESQKNLSTDEMMEYVVVRVAREVQMMSPVYGALSPAASTRQGTDSDRKLSSSYFSPQLSPLV